MPRRNSSVTAPPHHPPRRLRPDAPATRRRRSPEEARAYVEGVLARASLALPTRDVARASGGPCGATPFPSPWRRCGMGPCCPAGVWSASPAPRLARGRHGTPAAGRVPAAACMAGRVLLGPVAVLPADGPPSAGSFLDLAHCEGHGRAISPAAPPKKHDICRTVGSEG